MGQPAEDVRPNQVGDGGWEEGSTCSRMDRRKTSVGERQISISQQPHFLFTTLLSDPDPDLGQDPGPGPDPGPNLSPDLGPDLG